MSSDSEIEKYEAQAESGIVPSGCEGQSTNTTPITVSVTLARCTVSGLQGTRIRTQRSNIHHAGEDDDPAVHGIQNVATIELGR